MATKSIYIRDEDAPVWDKAKELAGESLSQFLTNHIKSFVASKEAEFIGEEKIILHYRDAGKFPAAKAFYGHWIIPPIKPYTHRRVNIFSGLMTTKRTPLEIPDEIFFYAVAITAKKNIVVFEFREQPDKTGKFKEGKLRVFSSIGEVSIDQAIPAGLNAAIMEQMGVEIEELDI